MELTPEAVLKNLDNLAAIATGNRETHATLSKSVDVLAEFIRAHTPASPPDPPPEGRTE